jgi:hypothetical protein
MMMLPSAGGRSQLFTLAVSAGAVIVFIFGLMAWQSPSRLPQPFSHKGPSRVNETYVYSIPYHIG